MRKSVEALAFVFERTKEDEFTTEGEPDPIGTLSLRVYPNKPWEVEAYDAPGERDEYEFVGRAIVKIKYLKRGQPSFYKLKSLEKSCSRRRL